MEPTKVAAAMQVIFRASISTSPLVGSPTAEEDGLTGTAMPGRFGRYSQDLVETAGDALKCVCGTDQYLGTRDWVQCKSLGLCISNIRESSDGLL
jgi:hypothetical protein